MQRMHVKLSFCMCAAVLFGLFGCGDSADGDDKPQAVDERPNAQQVRPVRWKVSGPPVDRKVRIASVVGYCVGAEKPRIKSVHVVEKARRVLLTAMLTVVKVGRESCAGVSLGVQKIIKLEHPLGERELYDASLSPPAKRWPRGTQPAQTPDARDYDARKLPRAVLLRSALPVWGYCVNAPQSTTVANVAFQDSRAASSTARLRSSMTRRASATTCQN